MSSTLTPTRKKNMRNKNPQTMRAIMCYGPEDYRLEEVPVPEIGPGEVLVRIESVGICASDIKCYTGAPLFWGDDTREAYCQPPVIPGHEFSGRVVALGEGANDHLKHGSRLAIGDLAVSEQIVPCWNCRFCQRGQYWMCDGSHDVYGFRQRTPGAMAEFMRFPADAINHKIPDSLPAHHAAYIEPLACAIHAVQRARIELDDVVVIAGCGPLGLGMIAAARLKNPACLVALDLRDYRLDVALKAGADLVFNPDTTDVVSGIRKITDGYGCDVYIEATGQARGVTQGLQMIRRLGRFVEFSVLRELVTTDWTVIGDTKELDILGSHLGPYCYPRAIEMLVKDQVPVGDIVTHTLPLEKYSEALNLVETATTSIKVVLEP